MSNGDVTFLDNTGMRATLIDGIAGPVNKLTENQANVETDTTGFTAVGSTLSRDAAAVKYGTYGLKVVCDNAAAGEGFYTDDTTVSASLPYIASVWLAGAAGGETVVLKLEERTAGASVGFFTTETITLTTTMTRYSVKGFFGSTGVRARLYVVNTAQAADTFYADGMMIEQGSDLSDYQTTTTVESPWVEVPADCYIRTFWSSPLEEGASDATVDILVSNATTKPDNVAYTGAVTSQQLTTAAQAATKTEAYRWVKAKKTLGTTPVATTVTMTAMRS